MVETFLLYLFICKWDVCFSVVSYFEIATMDIQSFILRAFGFGNKLLCN